MVVGDISEYAAGQLPAPDLLTAGFPCQPFSLRGLEAGLGDAKGQLFRELVRLLRAQRPRAFLFENVVGLVTGDGGARPARPAGPARPARPAREAREGGGAGNGSGAGSCSAGDGGGSVAGGFVAGRTFTLILDAFAGEGYAVSWRVVNARHWVPQNRERVYIVGTRADLGAAPMDWDAVFPGCGTGGRAAALGKTAPRAALAAPVAPTACGAAAPVAHAAAAAAGPLSTVRGILEDDEEELAAAELSPQQVAPPPYWGVIQGGRVVACHGCWCARATNLYQAVLDAASLCAASGDMRLIHLCPSFFFTFLGGWSQWAVVRQQCLSKAAAEDGTGGPASDAHNSGAPNPSSGGSGSQGGEAAAPTAVTVMGEPAWARVMERAIALDGKAPTLISGYHGAGNFTSKYICEEPPLPDARLPHRPAGHPQAAAAPPPPAAVGAPCWAAAGGAAARRDGLEGRRRPRFLTPRECAR